VENKTGRSAMEEIDDKTGKVLVTYTFLSFILMKRIITLNLCLMLSVFLSAQPNEFKATSELRSVTTKGMFFMKTDFRFSAWLIPDSNSFTG
jgi:hypothetical protein